MNESKFECLICGGKEYEKKIESNGIFGPGGRSWILYYICCGCSVMFTDVKKFTKKVEEKN